MSKTFITIVILCVFLWQVPAYSDTNNSVLLPRFPAPSPDGEYLAFTYHGDIWRVPITGGRAVRLTVHEKYDRNPVWSPSGEEIAFSSNRFGNDDVFVIPSDGGEAERVTFFSAGDLVSDWSADGKRLIFSSRRNFDYHRLSQLYQVSHEGGTPRMLIPEYGSQAKISPDGRYVVYTRGSTRWWRKRYRGSDNAEIWLYDTKTEAYQRFTTHEGNDMWPMWSADGKSIYYVSDEGGEICNIWVTDLQGKERKQVTYHKEHVRFANISRHGRVIAYELGAEIWYIILNGSKPSRINIIAPSDYKFNTVEKKTFSSDASEMEISPDEKEIAFVVRGEIFVMKNKEKAPKAHQITDNSARDFDIIWAPEGDTLVFASDRNGNYDLFMAVSDDPKEKRLSRTLKYKLIRLTDSKENETSPRFSPDGEKISFIRGKGDLCIMDRDGKNVKCIIEGWSKPNYRWSPDSKWIAFSRDDNEFNQDVFIVQADGGEPINITLHPDDDTAPVWSKDGRKLGFVSQRMGDTSDIWWVFLQKKDHQKTKEELEEEEEKKEEEKKEKKDEEKEDKEKKKEEKVEVKIDFKDIHKRLRRLTSLPGEEHNLTISPDGKTFLFVANVEGKNDLWSVRWDGEELKRLTSGGQNPQAVQWSKDGKNIYYMSKGKFKKMSFEGKDAKSLDFKARMTIDHRAEQLQKFDEAWRILNENFYDANFHGADWNKVGKKYREWAAATVTIDDFNDVVRMMLGELNASHLGIYGPDQGAGVSTGMLGLRFDDSYTGTGLKIKQILPDGPCDKVGVEVKLGDILVAVDDQEIGDKTNIHELLNDMVDEKVELTLQSPLTGKPTWTTIVTPISYGQFMAKEYDRWVNVKRETVRKVTDNKVGYLQIQAMGVPSLERFEMELYSVAHDKDALIIDVRNNGGGWTTDYLLAILSPKPHAITVPRDGGKGYPEDRRPLYAWIKPIVVMCNQHSYSNAEIFSHAIKTLGRGKVVGVPTAGAVISTGRTQLIDGAWFRIPFRGWYVVGSGVNMELNGCVPDYIIWDQPGDVAKSIDRQLDKAVEVILSELNTGR